MADRCGVVGDMKAIADPRDGEVIGMIVRPMKQLLATNNYQVDEITFVVETASPANSNRIEYSRRAGAGRSSHRRV